MISTLYNIVENNYSQKIKDINNFISTVEEAKMDSNNTHIYQLYNDIYTQSNFDDIIRDLEDDQEGYRQVLKPLTQTIPKLIENLIEMYNYMYSYIKFSEKTKLLQQLLPKPSIGKFDKPHSLNKIFQALDMKKENEYIYILFKRICDIFKVKTLFENDNYDSIKLINISDKYKIEPKFDYNSIEKKLTSNDGYITFIDEYKKKIKLNNYPELFNTDQRKFYYMAPFVAELLGNILGGGKDFLLLRNIYNQKKLFEIIDKSIKSELSSQTKKWSNKKNKRKEINQNLININKTFKNIGLTGGKKYKKMYKKNTTKNNQKNSTKNHQKNSTKNHQKNSTKNHQKRENNIINKYIFNIFDNVKFLYKDEKRLSLKKK